MVKTFEEFINEELSYEEDKNREALVNIVKRTLGNGIKTEILLKYFGLYKDKNGEYLEPESIENLALRYDFTETYIKAIIDKRITQLRKTFLHKNTDKPSYAHIAGRWVDKNTIKEKDRQTLFDLLSTITDKDVDVSDEDIENMRKGNFKDMEHMKNYLYWEEFDELKKILAKIEKVSPDDFEEEEFGVFVNTKTKSRYKVFLDKDKADDFVADNEENVLSDVMDYPYKYKSYDKHFYIVMLNPEE